MKGEIRFIGLLNETELLKRDSFDKLASIPHLDLILTSEQTSSYTSVNQDQQLYHYTLMTYSGQKNILKIGKFELIEISPDRKRERTDINGLREIYKTREFIFYDTILRRPHKFESKVLYDDFIILDLWTLIKKLNIIQDWELVMQFYSITNLENENINLKLKVEKQELIIQELKSQINK